MLNLIVEYPVFFGMLVCLFTGIPTAFWWKHYNKRQATASIAPGIQFSCVCGKTFPSKMKFDSHQQGGSCPKLALKRDEKQQSSEKKSTKPAPIDKPIEVTKSSFKASKEITPNPLKKAFKIIPRKKNKVSRKRVDEDVIIVNEKGKANYKIVIIKRK